MKRKKNLPLICGILTIALFFSAIGFTIGYYRYSGQIAKERSQREEEQQLLNALLKAQQDDLHNNEDNERSVTKNNDIINKETGLIYKVLYTQCQDIIEERLQPDIELIGLNKEGFNQYIKKNQLDWELESFSKEEVVLIKRENKVCPNHYLVSVNRGYIAIYKYDEEGRKVLVDQTEIPINVLPTVDQEKLQRGILIETLEEVNQLLEDYSS